MLACAQDREWGPISSCRPFDLTVRFEYAALLSADTIFLIFATLRILHLRGRVIRDRNTWSWLSATSLLLLLCSTAVNSWYGGRALQLQVVSSVFVTIVSIFETHLVSASSSSLVAIFALIKFLLTLAAARTSLYVDAFRVTISFAFVSTSYAILLCMELAEKRAGISIPYMWLVPILWKGRIGVLNMQDFGPIPTQMNADNTFIKLHATLMTTNKTKKFYLLIASFKAFGSTFFAPVLPRLCLLAATFAQPLLVSRMLRFISNMDEPSSTGWNLAAGYTLAFVTMSISTGIYWKKTFDFIVEYRGALVGAIYHKTLILSSRTSSAVASTYMSVDVDRICKTAEMIHELWQSAVSVLIAMYLLYREVSWLACLPLMVIGAVMVCSLILTRLTTRAQTAWLSETDTRVRFITSVVHNFLPIKWSSYEQVLAARGAFLRENELRGAAKFMKYLSYSVSISNAASNGCILAVLAAYSLLNKGSIDPAKLFTIVSILYLLSSPLIFLGQLLPVFAAAWASLIRIQDYLLLDETTAGLELDREAGSDYEDKIILNSASFSWSSTDESPFLRNISLRFDKPQLHLVVGPVASGKSMLLVSMLGETTCTSGDYSCPRFRVAYAQQDTFIIPASIRENITFGSPFKPEWYEQVIEACALKADLDLLNLGDGTLLNERGNQLSGGQKQRVGLARAVYANATWTLLDDPLSALDAHTEAHVFQTLFGKKGLLRGKSVVLVTHNLKYVSDADTIIVMESGKVQHQGLLSDIKAQGYVFEAARTNGDEKTIVDHDPEKLSTEYIKEEDSAEPPVPQSSLGLVPYRFTAEMIGYRRAAVIPVLLFIVGCTPLAFQYYLRGWSTSRGENAGAWIGGYAALTVFFMLLYGFGFYAFAHNMIIHGGKYLHAKELQGFLGATPTLIAKIPTGRLVNRFTQDISQCDFPFPIAVWNVVTTFIIVVGNIAFVMLPVPWLAFVLIPLSALYYFNLILYLGTSKQLEHLVASSKSPIYTLCSTTVNGLITIRSLRAQTFFLAQSEGYLNSSQTPFYYRYGGIGFMRTLLSVISSILAISLASLAVRLRDMVDPSALGLALVALTTLTNELSHFLMSVSSLENSSVAVSRVHEICQLEPEQGNHVPLVEFSGPSGGWIEEGSVTYENVELRYKKDLDPAVKNVSFKISSRQKVGICGRSGSGKSTLIMALFRSLNVDGASGKILIDNMDIQSVSLDVLRSSLGLVAQDPFIWNAPIRHNLDPHNDHEDKDLWATLKRVGLDDDVAALPEQLDTVLSDESSFSKGQRQLLCMARVLLRNSKIVILDEASSSLDVDTDEKMRRIIHSDLVGSTVITVAHRIATIVDYDLILVMDDGVLVETGAPRELLRRPGSLFRKLAERQGVKV